MAVSKEDILDTISNMSVMDVVELIEAMEEKFGVSAAAAVAAAPAAAAQADEADKKEVPAKPEKSADLTVEQSLADVLVTDRAAGAPKRAKAPSDTDVDAILSKTLAGLDIQPLRKREKAPPHHARHARPADQGQDDGDPKVDPDR